MHKHHTIQSEYAHLASDYDRRWRRYVEVSTRMTLAYLPTQAKTSLLDVSCGTGILLHAVQTSQYTPLKLVGVDISRDMLLQAQHRLSDQVALIQATASRLPFPDASFSLATCVSALHHFAQPEHTLAEIHRVLEPGGCLILTDWCADYLSSRLVHGMLQLLGRPLERVLGSAACRQLLTETGFRPAGMQRYRIGITWGMMTVVARKSESA